MNSHLETLEQAEVYFQQHRFTEGAQLVRQAAYGAIAAAAAAQGVSADNPNAAYKYASRLDGPDPDNSYQYALHLDVADLYIEQAAALNHNYEMNADWQWDPDEYTEYLNGIRRMIASLPTAGSPTPQAERPSPAPCLK